MPYVKNRGTPDNVSLNFHISMLVKPISSISAWAAFALPSAMAPEFLTQKRSPARPRMKAEPLVAGLAV